MKSAFFIFLLTATAALGQVSLQGKTYAYNNRGGVSKSFEGRVWYQNSGVKFGDKVEVMTGVSCLNKPNAWSHQSTTSMDYEGRFVWTAKIKKAAGDRKTGPCDLLNLVFKIHRADGKTDYDTGVYGSPYGTYYYGQIPWVSTSRTGPTAESPYSQLEVKVKR